MMVLIFISVVIKKESPNEGTETFLLAPTFDSPDRVIKKESPNEGTETPVVVTVHSTLSFHKKRIPE